MKKKLDKKNHSLKLRWLILLIFPIGWWFTIGHFQSMTPLADRFTDLTFISFVASFFILYKLKGDLAKEAHLWTIYFILLVGHYIQFYLMIYWKHIGDINLEIIFSESVVSLLSSLDIVINVYTLSTLALCSFAIAVYFISKSKNNAKHSYKYIQFDEESEKVIYFPKKNFLFICTVLLIVISITLLFIYADLRVNARVNEMGLGGTVLKYKLTGILVYGNELVIPGFFILLIFFADQINEKATLNISIGFYLFHAVFFSVFTTSKAPIPIAIISLAAIWILSGRLTPVRRSLIIAGLTLIPLIFGTAMTLRFMREVGEIGQFKNVPAAIEFLFSDDNFRLVKSQFALITRIAGTDTLLEITRYDPASKLYQIYSYLLDNNFHIGRLYKLEVKGYPDIAGVGFSPGLLGCFYLLSGNQIIVSMCMFIYTFFWHIIFKFIVSKPLVVKPVAIAQVSLFIVNITSEGTLFKLPFQIFLMFCMIVLVELASRKIMGASIK
jgi:hypothetical protein